MNFVASKALPIQGNTASANRVSSQTSNSSTAKTSSEFKKNEAFGAVFNQFSVKHHSQEMKTPVTDQSSENLGEVASLLQVDSLEGLLKSIDLNVEDLEISGPMTFEKLASLLELNEDELKASIEELIGQEVKTNDLWELLGQIDLHASTFLKSVMESLEGVGKVPPQQAATVLQFLKGAELAAPKTDLLLKQELAVFNLKELMQSLSSQLEKLMNANTSQHGFSKGQSFQSLSINFAKSMTAEEPTETTTVTQTASKVTETTTQTVTVGLNTQVKTETVTVNLPVAKAAQSEALIKEFQALLNRSQFGKTGGMTKMLIKMYPEHLGTIRVELVQKDGIMTARMLANTSLGKEMLDSQLHQLKSAFANANVQVDRIDVTQALQDSSKNDKQQQFGQSLKQQQQDQEQQDQEETPEQTSFREFLMELEA
ncbi:MAG: flagellar hook-length control protein FliK [Planococcaceae bacterium]|nr:flagellar hook-length control protein FliK [Planococcaceae bacterium]